MSALVQFDAEQEMLAAEEMRKQGFIPYAQRGPQTNDLNELRRYLHEVREQHGRGSSAGAEAYNRLAKAASQAGSPLDGLSRYSKNEAERFFARTRPGPEGHVYWDRVTAENGFRRNDGRYRQPARWWWEHLHGPIGTNTMRVYPLCGEKNCINPEHSECRPFQGRRHSDEQLLGFLKVASLRAGAVVSGRTFDKYGFPVTSTALKFRFGSWAEAVKQAGMTGGAGPAPVTAETATASLRAAEKFLGHPPTTGDYRTNKSLHAHLAERKLPLTPDTIRRELGPWKVAIAKACGS